MIEAEKREHKPGYADRIKALEEVKKMSRIDKECASSMKKQAMKC